MRHLAFIGPYINAPAGNYENPPKLIFLENIICKIGKKYGTIKGSDFAKGKHYIKHKITNCRGRHIKLMIQAVDNALVKNDNDVKYVWRFNNETYAEIFRLIISFIADNSDSLQGDIKKEITVIALEKPNPEMTYYELLIRNPLIGLSAVVHNGNSEKVRNNATKIWDEIHNSKPKSIKL